MTLIFLLFLSLFFSVTQVHSFQRSFLLHNNLKSISLSRHYYSNEVLPDVLSVSKNFRDYVIETESLWSSLQLSDTSISEEEVLEVTGQVTNLPDPLIAVAFAAVVFLGVAILQFSLGDLTKEV